MTPLIYATERELEDVVNLLLDHGADVDGPVGASTHS